MTSRFWMAILFMAVATQGILSNASASIATQPHQYAWGQQVGTSVEDYAFGLAADNFGNSFMAGYTSGSIGGPHAGRSDAFLSKLDSSGNVLWSRQLGSSGEDFGYSVAVDALGNAYFSGHTDGDLFGMNAGHADLFIAKYSASGDLVWSRQFGGTTGEQAHSIAVDGTGNAYVAGTFINSTPNEDVFLAKFDSSGTFLWSREFGTPSVDGGASVAVDGAGNVFVTGQTSGQLGDVKIGITDAFLAKYDGAGNHLWTEQFGTNFGTYGRSVAVDSAGNAYVGGTTDGSFGGVSAGFLDAFIAKFDSSGNSLWARQLGSTAADHGFGVGVDSSDFAYLGGSTQVDESGLGFGLEDVYLAKYDSSGNHLWTEQVGTPLPELTYAMAVAPNGTAFLGGNNYASIGGTFEGVTDAFIVKFAPIPEPSSWVLIVAAAAACHARWRC